MFGEKKKKQEDSNSGVMQKSARGSMDEYEALSTIVAENQGLLIRVLEKIRVARALSGKAPNKGDTRSDESKSKEVAPKREVKKEQKL